MNSTENPGAPVAAQITEADIVAYLTQKAAEVAKVIGEEYASVRIEVLNSCYGSPAKVECGVYVNGGGSKQADTLDAAIAKQLLAMLPENRAKTLREQAAKMLAEADQLQNGRAA